LAALIDEKAHHETAALVSLKYGPAFQARNALHAVRTRKQGAHPQQALPMQVFWDGNSRDGNSPNDRH
jgi:hypothetical protein